MNRLALSALVIGLSGCATHWASTDAYKGWTSTQKDSCSPETLSHIKANFNFPVQAENKRPHYYRSRKKSPKTFATAYEQQCAANSRLLKRMKSGRFTYKTVRRVTFPFTDKLPTTVSLQPECAAQYTQPAGSVCYLERETRKKMLYLRTKYKRRGRTRTATMASHNGKKERVVDFKALDDKALQACKEWLHDQAPKTIESINAKRKQNHEKQLELAQYLKSKGVKSTNYFNTGKTENKDPWAPPAFVECTLDPALVAFGVHLKAADTERRSKPHVAHTKEAYKKCVTPQVVAQKRVAYCQKIQKNLSETKREYRRKLANTRQVNAARARSGYRAFNYNWSSFTNYIDRLERWFSDRCIPYGVFSASSMPKGAQWKKKVGEQVKYCEQAESTAWQEKALKTCITDEQKEKVKQFIANLPKVKAMLKAASK